jgi:hypothetical protein
VRPKVIQIGFNRTGTSSLAKFFNINGYNVAGHAQCANKVLNNIKNNRLPFQNLDFDLAQDLEDHKNNIYIQNYYQEIDTAHPDTKFILTTRSCEKWIESRLNHNAGRYVRRAMRNLDITDVDQLCDQWRQDFYQYHLDVTNYFSGHGNFYTLPLEKIDCVGLINFLGEDFEFKDTNYPKVQRPKKGPPNYDLSIED